MEFFTLDWWVGCQKGATDDALRAYEEHYRSLSGVPTALDELSRNPGLHDAHLRDLSFDQEQQTLRLALDVDPGDGSLERQVFAYLGVVSFSQHSDPERRLPGPGGFGDLGYDEVHRAGEHWEHRLLFSSGIEIRVRFLDFVRDDEAAARATRATSASDRH